MEATEEAPTRPPVCGWTLRNDTVWRTECKNEMLDGWTSFDFKFCPFCGGNLLMRDQK